MRLEPNDLSLFLRVAEAGSLSGAAQKLSMPLSTVSRHISALEAKMGERVFLRTTRKLTVTDLGRALLEHARKVVDGVEAASLAFAAGRPMDAGRLRVRLPANLTLLAPFLADFLASYPSISLEVEASTRDGDMGAENFDVLICSGQLCSDTASAAVPILELRSNPYASPSYLERSGAPRHPDALRAHHGLLAPTPGGHSPPWILERGETCWEGLPSGRAIVSCPNLLVRMAIEGAGIAVVEETAAEQYVATGQLVRILPEWRVPPLPLWTIVSGGARIPARTRAFVDALSARFLAASAPKPATAAPLQAAA